MEQSPRRSLRAWLAEPVDAASLAFFRFAFGLTLFVEVCRFFAHGWIARYYIEPVYHFHYFGFGWVQPWPSWGMYVHFAALGAVAICAAIGLWYRVTSVLLWLMFTYVFLLEEARYLNHFYAASLLALLLAVVPAATVFSIDSLRHNRDNNAAISRWALVILRFQTGAIYFFGGLAKINPDWMRGEPMRSWLLAKADSPIISLIVRNNLELALFSYGGMLFDLAHEAARQGRDREIRRHQQGDASIAGDRPELHPPAVADGEDGHATGHDPSVRALSRRAERWRE